MEWGVKQPWSGVKQKWPWVKLKRGMKKQSGVRQKRYLDQIERATYFPKVGVKVFGE